MSRVTLKWSEASLRDIVRLHRFLAPKSPGAAARAVAAIQAGVRILAQHPEIGRPVEEMPADFREWIVEFGQSAYVVLYHFDAHEVVILAVRHGREAGY